MVKKTTTKKKAKAKKKSATKKAVAGVKEEKMKELSRGNIANNELQVVSPAQLISEAVAKGANLEKLKQAMEAQERWERNEGKKAYYRDMASVQSEIEIIEETETNQETHSTYAKLGKIICKTKPIYTGKGFSITFHEGVTEKPDHVRVCALVSHSLGYEKEFFYDVPLDGSMTPIHGKSSSVSYGRRYLMCLILNLPTGDDNDGNTQEKQKPEYEPPSEEAYKGYPDAEKGNPDDFHQEPSKEEAAKEEKPTAMTQEMLGVIIDRALYFNWLPANIRNVFESLGHNFKGKMRQDLKVEDFYHPVSLKDYETILETVSEEFKEDDQAKK